MKSTFAFQHHIRSASSKKDSNINEPITTPIISTKSINLGLRSYINEPHSEELRTNQTQDYFFKTHNDTLSDPRTRTDTNFFNREEKQAPKNISSIFNYESLSRGNMHNSNVFASKSPP
jgi:hypothetical protein